MKNKLEKQKMKIEDFDSLLRCKLNSDELLARGNELAEASAEVATLEDQLASIKKEYGAKIDGKQARINELSGTIRAKSETRTVKCERQFDFEKGKVTEIRLDTAEIFNTRDITDGERQQTLELSPVRILHS